MIEKQKNHCKDEYHNEDPTKTDQIFDNENEFHLTSCGLSVKMIS